MSECSPSFPSRRAAAKQEGCCFLAAVIPNAMKQSQFFLPNWQKCFWCRTCIENNSLCSPKRRCVVFCFFLPPSFSRHTLYLYLNAWNRLNLECKISIAPTQQRQTVKWCWILVLRKLLLVQLNARKGGLVPLPLVLKTVTLSSCDKRGVHLSEGKNGSYVAGTKV